MENQDYIKRLDKYIAQKRITDTEMARRLNVRRENLNRWRNGTGLSQANKNAILAMTADLEETCHYIGHCPIKEGNAAEKIELLKWLYKPENKKTLLELLLKIENEKTS